MPAGSGSGGLTSAQVAAASPITMARFCKMVRARKVGGDDVEIFEGEPAPLELWEHQRELLTLAVTRRRVISLKARQLGVTWTWALLALWYACTHPGSQTVIVSVGERESQSVIRRIMYLHDSMPESLKQVFRLVRSTNEVVEIHHPDGNALIVSLPSSSTAGRGETVNLLILDECAHWDDASNRMASLLPTTADIGQVVVSSTANGIGGYFYDLWETGEQMGWTRLFSGALARPDRDAEWVERMRAQLDLQGVEKGRSNLGAQEYPMTPMEAFISTGGCVFPTEVLADYLEHSVRDDQWRGTMMMDVSGVKTVRDQNGLWRVWSWRQPGRKYLITGDPCGGGGGLDSGHMVVGDVQSLDQMACFHGKPEPEEFARQMYRAGWLWNDGRSPAVLAPEANEWGRAVLALLREWGYPNLWATKRFDQRRAEERVREGWLTTSASRPVMIAALQEGLREGSLGVRDKLAVGEFQRFIANPRTGRPQAMEGYHDDRTMAWAIFAAIALREASGVHQESEEDAVPTPYRRAESSLTGY